MLKKNIRPNEDGTPVELTIGDDITLRFVKVGERIFSVTVDAPPERKVMFKNLAAELPTGTA